MERDNRQTHTRFQTLAIGSGAPSLQDLPYSLVRMILQHLDAVSLCRLEQSCRRYRRLLRQPGLLKEEEEEENTNNHSVLDDEEAELSSSLSIYCWKLLELNKPCCKGNVKRLLILDISNRMNSLLICSFLLRLATSLD